MATEEGVRIKKAKDLLKENGYELIPEHAIKCLCCGEIKTVNQSGNYLASDSELHKNCKALYKPQKGKKKVAPKPYMRNYIPYCQNCLSSKKDFYNVSDTIETLRLMDKPYIKTIWDSTMNKYDPKNKSAILGRYCKNLVMNYAGLTFKNSDNWIEKEVVEDISQKETDIENIMFWGKGYDYEQYLFLDGFFNDMMGSYECDTPVQVNLFKNMAKTQLQADVALEDKNIKLYESLMKTMSTLMGDSNIKPVQETGANANEHLGFGVLLQKYEKDRPTPEPLDEWKDPDNMQFFGEVFAGHMGRMFDVKSSFIEKFKKIIAPFTVTPSKFEDGDE